MTVTHMQSGARRPEKPQNVLLPQHEKSKRRKHIDMIGLATAIAGLVAAGYAGWSVHVASQANIASEQQQLLTDSTSIAEQLNNQQTTINNAVAGLTGPTRERAIANAEAVIAGQVITEGEAAQVLITTLRGDGVAGMEYIQAGRALDDAGDAADALADYQAAETAPPHALATTTLALQYAGTVEYSLGHAAVGHKDMMAAVKDDSGYHPYSTEYDLVNDMAQDYYSDASQQLNINGCATANTDMTAGNHAIAAVGGINNAKAVVISDYDDDHLLYETQCLK